MSPQSGNGDLGEIPLLSGIHSDAKPSVIQKMCDDAINSGHHECIWVCYNRGQKYFARDIRAPIDEGFDVYRLRYIGGLWKRISLRSPIKVQVVNVHFLEQKGKEVEVMVLPVNVDLEMKEIEQYLQESPASGECDAGVNENGLLQSCTFGSLCPNTKMGGHNDYPYFYCAQEYHHELRLRKRRLAHREALLEFYWSSQGKSDSHQFLKESGLITQYSHLKTTHFLDAADSCGEGILALLLVDGWHKRNLLILAGLAVLISISVTALTTAVTRDLDAGLTAGSYTSGVAALLIATLTFFSAVL